MTPSAPASVSVSALVTATLWTLVAMGCASCGAAEFVQPREKTRASFPVDEQEEPGVGVRPSDGLWIERARLASLPKHGAAWDGLLKAAKKSMERADLSNQDDPTNTYALAKALVFARTGEARYRDEVLAVCDAIIGTESGGNTLALGRNLGGYVLAADLVGLPTEQDARFKQWLHEVVRKRLGGRTIISTHEDRPNNWGTHAGATRIAVALYLDDTEELRRAARVFRGWLGDRKAYAGFKYRDLDWQADPKKPVGINPVGSKIEGHSVDGVLPDDQRRGGGFSWPPPRENYVYEALQGALAQAVLLQRAGYDPWNWSDRALLRAYRWLHDEANYPAQGDDIWQIHVVNRIYGTDFPAKNATRAGKNVGFTGWTHPAPDERR